MKLSFRALLLGSWLFAVCCGPASAQQPKMPQLPPLPDFPDPNQKLPAPERAPASLYISGVTPHGVRTSVTEEWGAFEFSLVNFTDSDRRARICAFYVGHPDVQYGRDVWVPAHSTLKSWMLVGPAPTQNSPWMREIEMLLYDRSNGEDEIVRPRTEERIRSRGVIYHPREPATSVLMDDEDLSDRPEGQPPQPQSQRDEIYDFIHVFRNSRKLSAHFQIVRPGMLPPSAKAFDGVDHFVLASDRLVHDPAGMRALRHWLQRGGKVWVLLDHVGAKSLAALLGDAFDFELLDRITLTSFRIETRASGAAVPGPQPPLQQHDRPVELVRVVLPAGEEPRHTVNGWPIWFTRAVGKGEVVFTTLGARGWYRQRTVRDKPSPYIDVPFLPIPGDALSDVALELHPSERVEPISEEAFAPMLTEEIGYSVIGRGSVALILSLFLVGALGLGLMLRKAHRPELLGWLGPAAAVIAAAVFVLIGEASRRTVPPTLAAAQIVDAVSGKDEASARGLLEVYRPQSGAFDSGTDKGGFFDLDMEGLDGQSRRFLVTDMGAWHWDNLELPAGVRRAPFRTTIITKRPIEAAAHFGPNGLEGKLAAGPFHDLSDALLRTPNGRSLAVHVQADGTFRTDSADILPRDEYLAGAVLTDRQQRRKEIYRVLLKRPALPRETGGNVLYVWADAGDPAFRIVPPNARMVGNSLLTIPLRLERSTARQRVTVPGPLIPYRRITDNGPVWPTMTGTGPIDMHLRFQLPRCLLPLTVEHAVLSLKMDAPARKVTIAGLTKENKPVEIRSVQTPLDVVRVEIRDASLLHPDAEGGLHLNVRISDRQKGEGMEKWTIDYLELEVGGRCQQ